MPRPQFETVVAQAPKEKLVRAYFTPTNHIQPTNEEEIIFYSSPNTVARVVGIRLEYQGRPSSVSGDHEVFVSYDIPEIPENLNVMYGRENFNTRLAFTNGYWEQASLSSKPDYETTMLQNLQFDDEIGLRVLYRNNGDLANTSQRVYIVTWVEREVR